MKEVEDLLKLINKEKKRFHFSLDIYYNDVDDTFVCKVHSYGEDLKEFTHFRNKELMDSMLDAHNFVRLCDN